MKKMYSLRLEFELMERLNKIAEQENRTLSNMFETLIRDFAEGYKYRAISKPLPPAGVVPSPTVEGVNLVAYDFSGVKWLDINKYTKYPLSERPKNAILGEQWDRDKKASDDLIRAAYEQQKTPV